MSALGQGLEISLLRGEALAHRAPASLGQVTGCLPGQKPFERLLGRRPGPVPPVLDVYMAYPGRLVICEFPPWRPVCTSVDSRRPVCVGAGLV